jgi:hypothetical protein
MGCSDMGSLNPMTFALLVLALVVARREERGPEHVAPGGGTGSSGGGGSPPPPPPPHRSIVVPSTIPSFLHMPISQAAAWAHIIGLQPHFNPEHGKIVKSQRPRAGEAMPIDGKVHLEMGEDIQQNASS